MIVKYPDIKQTLFAVLCLSLASVSFAEETRTWTGKWNNKKYGTTGPLKCVANETKPGQWSGVFTGTFKGDPFEYKAQFQAKPGRKEAALAGKATIRGHQYEWTGALGSQQLRGKYTSTIGYYGEFSLKETARQSPPPSSRNSGSGNRSEVKTQRTGVKNGERILFVGNSYMANEGGVFNYLARALQVGDGTRIETEKYIYYGRPLNTMAKPEVRTAIASEKFDSVVITSGQLATMKKFATGISDTGKRAVIFMTWEARHPGNRATEKRYTDATIGAIRDMRQIERETGATIIPAAVVYHDLTLRPPSGVSRVDYLWRPGNIHQNELGTMVNAWMFYAVLTGKSPVGINFDMPPFVVGEKLKQDPDMRFTPELRTSLQERVWDVARAWKSGKTHLE